MDFHIVTAFHSGTVSVPFVIEQSASAIQRLLLGPRRIFFQARTGQVFRPAFGLVASDLGPALALQGHP